MGTAVRAAPWDTHATPWDTHAAPYDTLDLLEHSTPSGRGTLHVLPPLRAHRVLEGDVGAVAIGFNPDRDDGVVGLFLLG